MIVKDFTVLKEICLRKVSAALGTEAMEAALYEMAEAVGYYMENGVVEIDLP